MAKSIDTNISGNMPHGDPAPKRNPKDGGKKTKIGFGIVGTGIGVDAILEVKNPKPGEDAVKAHTEVEKQRVKRDEPTIWENIINLIIK